MSEQLYDYGQCAVCGAQMIEQRIKQDFWLKGALIVIADVPAGVCPRCGEKIVKAEVGRQIATLLANPQRAAAHSISVPVIQFQAAA